MPRDASGNYTLPTGNPVVAGTIIESEWANPTMSDLGNEITDSLSRAGEGGMLAPLKHVDGSSLLPSVTFLNDIQSGLYLNAPAEVVMSVAGADVMRWIAGNAQIWTGSTWSDIATDSSVGNSFLALDGTNWPVSILRVSENFSLSQSGDAVTIFPTDSLGAPVGAASIYFEPTIADSEALFSLNNDQSGPYFTVECEVGGGRLEAAQGGGQPYLTVEPNDMVTRHNNGGPLFRASNTQFRWLAASGQPILDLSTTSFAYTAVGATGGFTFSGNVFDLDGALRLNEDITFEGVFEEGFKVKNVSGGGRIDLVASDTGGTERAMVRCDPESNVQIEAAGGVVTARTTSASNGGLEINNTETGAGFERALTESDISKTPTTLTLTPTVDWISNANIKYQKVGNIVFFDWTVTYAGAGSGDDETFAQTLPAGFRPSQAVQCVLREISGSTGISADSSINGDIQTSGSLSCIRNAPLSGTTYRFNGIFFIN